MIDPFSLQRALMLSLLLLSFGPCSEARCQAERSTQRAPIAHASTAQDKALSADKKTDATSTEDAVVSVTHVTLYKDGAIHAKRIGSAELFGLPAGIDNDRRAAERAGMKIQVKTLPIGFSVYHDNVFEIRTQAIAVGESITFRLPSVQSEEEFKKLTVLYLDEDSLVPGTLKWQISDKTPRANFSARTLSAGFEFTSVFQHKVFDDNGFVGRVVVADFNQAEFDESSLDLAISSVVGPPSVKVGEIFTYSITIHNGGGKPIPATDTAFNSIRSNGRFVRVSSTVGKCRESANYSVVICELGKLAPGQTAVVRITVKAESDPIIEHNGQTVFAISNIVMSREKDYSPKNNSYESRSTTIRR
jgi:hypothetical protein